VSQVDDLKGYSVTSLRPKYSDISDKELVEALHKKYLNAHPAYRYGFEQIDTKYEKIVYKNSNNTVKTLLYVAIGVPISLYFFGWAFVWIRRGFKIT